MATASQRVDGLVSGLSTSDLITQLLSLEKQPQVRLQASRTSANSAITAYQTINSKVDALRVAADALASPAAWGQAKATSSDPAAVAVTASASAQTASLDFTVERLATAHALVSHGSVGSTASIVASGPITITGADGTATEVPVGDGSLASVVAAVNASDTGVRAAAVKVGEGVYRLQLTAAATGTASAFTVDLAGGTGPLGGADVLRAGVDARLVVGDPDGTHYEVTSASNTMSDVLPGVTFTLAKTGSVRVDVTRDDAAIADKVQSLISAANAALEEIGRQTAYTPDAARQSVLVGDSTARRLADDILRSVTAGGSAAAAGVQLTRDGKLSVDRTKLLAALQDDPAAVTRLFAQAGTATSPAVTLAGAGDKAAAGTYGITVTAPGSAATAVGRAVPGGALAADERIEIRVGTTTVGYDAAAGQTLTAVASGLQHAFAAAGLSLVASVEDGALAVRSAAKGSTIALTVLSAGDGPGQTGLPLGTAKGSDVAGTFTLADGTVVAGTGSGATLTAPAGHPVLDALAVTIAGGATGALGALTYAPGLAQRLEGVATSAVEARTGRLATAIDGRKRLVADLDVRIADWDRRLELKEAALSRQFSALEVALGKLKEQSGWLAGQLSSLS